MSKPIENLSPFDVDGLREYQANLERTVETVEAHLEREKAKLENCKMELEIRARQGA